MKVIQIISVLIIASFASCMPMMMGGGGSHGSAPEATSSIVKEVRGADAAAILILPPLKVGEESTIILRLFASSGQKPISGSEAIAHVMMSPSMSADHNHSQAMNDSVSSHLMLTLTEGAVAGTYASAFRPTVDGKAEFSVTVKIPAGGAESTLTLDAEQQVSASHAEHSGGMMGGRMGGNSIYWIVGAAVMVGMMAWRFF
jgi:hypothetical protein